MAPCNPPLRYVYSLWTEQKTEHSLGHRTAHRIRHRIEHKPRDDLVHNVGAGVHYIGRLRGDVGRVNRGAQRDPRIGG